MRYLAMVLFILITAGLIALAIKNFFIYVSLSLVVWQTPPIPVGWLLLLAFFLGALMLYAISVASAWQDKRDLLKLRVRVNELEQQAATRPIEAKPVSSGPLPATNPVIPMPGMSVGTDISDMTTLH